MDDIDLILFSSLIGKKQIIHDTPVIQGLEYEVGEYTPSEDTARPLISFANSHSTTPVFVLLVDASDEYDGVPNAGKFFIYYDWYRLWNIGEHAEETTQYARATYGYGGSTGTTISSNSSICTTNSDSDDDTTSSCSKYYATASGFYPYFGNTTRFCQQDVTYKWIAVWKPAT